MTSLARLQIVVALYSLVTSAAFAVAEEECWGKDFYDDKRVKNVCDSNVKDFFERYNKDRACVLKFYAPWCGHCRAMHDTYEGLVDFLDDKAMMGAVDCTSPQSNICKEFGVSAFPTVRFFKKGSGGRRSTVYKGPRNSAEIMADVLRTAYIDGADAESGSGKTEEDDDVVVNKVRTAFDIDITTLLRVCAFAQHVGSALSLGTVSLSSSERPHALVRIGAPSLVVACVALLHLVAAYCALVRPCSLVFVLSVAWGYFEAVLFAVAEAPPSFLDRAASWLVPLSCVWLQIHKSTHDSCSEVSQLVSETFIELARIYVDFHIPLPSDGLDWSAMMLLSALVCTFLLTMSLVLCVVGKCFCRKRPTTTRGGDAKRKKEQ